MNSAQNVQAVNDIKQTTQSLNTAMTNLKHGVANHNQVVQSDNYVNADTNKKMITTMLTTMRMTLLMVMHNIQL